MGVSLDRELRNVVSFVGLFNFFEVSFVTLISYRFARVSVLSDGGCVPRVVSRFCINLIVLLHQILVNIIVIVPILRCIDAIY